MAHEFLCGSTPFETPNVEEALLKIISGKIDWKWETAPSLAARRFIEALLCPDVRRRLGCTVNAAQGIKNHEFISCIPPPVLPTTVAFGKNLANYTPPTSPGSRSSSSRPSKSRKNSKDSPTLLSAYSRQSSQESIAPPRGRRGRSRSRSARSRSRRRNSSNASFGSSWLSGYTTDSASDLEHESDEDSSFASAGPSTRSSLWDWTIPSTRSSECRPDEEYLDLTDKVAELDRYPFESGSVADIYKAELTATKLPVAVKIFRRMHYERETFEKTSKYLYQEARIWQQLEHPNILPFLGIASNLGRSPALISPLCVSGPIMKHLQHKKKDQHERLQMIIGVAEGLAYLHSQGIVHGNLCTKKILVDAGGSPVICGYGMSKALRQPASSATTSLFSSPTRFAPPESFVAKGSSLARSDSGDVYSFSMIVLEILSGLPPYHDLGSEQAVFIHVVRGGRPSRTQDIVISNDVWRFLTWVWNESPPSRPGMPDIILSLLSFREKNLHGSVELRELAAERASILSSGSEASPSLGDIALPEVIDNVNGRDLKGRVRQVDQYPFAGGANSNVYRGKLTRSNGRKIRVAIKMLRVSDDGSGQMEEISRRLKRQVDLWAGLKHQNVLPFFGVCDDIAPWPVLVSPFYKLGHIGTYVRMNPAANREELACGVASGLQYLHGREIVHGDLKVQNVLVDKRGSPCICDFGISKIIGHRGFTTCSVGTAPYMAPELFLVLDAPPASMQSSPSTTKSSDVYSFGLLVLEILTCQPPKGRPSRPIVTAEVLADLRPKRADYDEELVKEESWVVLDRCWNSNPDQRPEIVEVHQRLARSFRKTKWLL
ncbi:kinase-like domain-containing protein [Roridomyces roridus]|uniref:Kinase-like domain-containing protein n=1 Tax=Roridomyces roridus TaxID=1738132 RepID=A0AAD7FEM4_9AGAR|nr:kinase-like domain-containing protein [Roridomyces roridus]